MVDRQVKVTLSATAQQYIAEMKKAEQATKDSATKQKKSLSEISAAAASVGKSAVVMGTVAAAGLAYVLKTTADFEAQMAQVQALSHATADDMSKLRDAALQAGQGIGISASQVADAETELVKAGVSVKDQLGGALVGTLDLAAAGQMNVADATQIAAAAMTEFHLAGKDVPHIADLLAAGADKALGSVSDLGGALGLVGPQAHSMGISLEETVGSLALFAQNGIIGSRAGEEMRSMLLSLTSPSQQAADVMKKYGITLYDAQGNFVGLSGVAQQLHDHLGSLDQATRNAVLGQIVSNAAVGEATILMQGGAKQVDKWTKSVNDQGFAAEQASGKMNSLNGDLAKLRAAFESNVIKAGSASTGVLRDIAKDVTTLIKMFGDLPEPIQQGTVAALGITAAVGLAGGAFLLGVPKVVAFGAALETLAGSQIPAVALAAGGLSSALSSAATFMTGPWGIALGVAATAVGGTLIGNVVAAQQKIDGYTDSLDKNTGALTDNTRAQATQNLYTSGALAAAHKVGISTQVLVDAALGNAKAQTQVNAVLSAQTQMYQENSKGVGDAGGAQYAAAIKAAKAVGIEQGALEQSKNANKAWLQANEESKKALGDVADAASKMTDAVNVNGVSADAASAAYKSNKDALNTLSDAAETYITTVRNQTGSTFQANAAQQAMIPTLYNAAVQMGMNADQATDYTAKILGIPASQVTTFLSNAADVQTNVQNLNQAIANLTDSKTIRITEEITQVLSQVSATREQAQHQATGGFITGPGTGTSDSIPAWLSNGEYVIRASQVGKYRGVLDAINSGRAMSPGLIASAVANGYAAGGVVRPVQYAQPQYVQYGTTQSVSGPTVNVSPVVSLEGATLVGTMDGTPFRMQIDHQIAANNDARARAAKAGW